MNALRSLAVLTLLLSTCGLAYAQTYSVGNLQVSQPWSQELPPNAPTVAAYFVIENRGMNADRLLGVDSPIATETALHEHVTRDGMMKMQPVTGVNVPAGATVTFAPMAYHVMLIDPQDRSLLQDGQQFPLTLHFEKAGDLQVQVEVVKQPH